MLNARLPFLPPLFLSELRTRLLKHALLPVRSTGVHAVIRPLPHLGAVRPS